MKSHVLEDACVNMVIKDSKLRKGVASPGKRSTSSKMSTACTNRNDDDSPVTLAFDKATTAQQTMVTRWVDIIRKRIPISDLIDIADESRPIGTKKRQFAAQYSSSAYQAMIALDIPIGDYIAETANGFVFDYTREQVVLLTE